MKNMIFSWPLLKTKAGKWPLFLTLFKKLEFRGGKNATKSGQMAKKSGQMATFENKSGHEKYKDLWKKITKKCEICIKIFGKTGFVARWPLFL